MTEAQLRQQVVDIMANWAGRKESDGSHKQIIDTYNAYKPLARGYKVTYKDAWCATAVSAAFIKAGLTDIAPTECSCGKMIELYKAKGRFEEKDSYKPQKGDVIMYDWQDDGKGDNTGNADHVGIVAAVDGDKLKVIEGNYNDAVGYRTLTVGGKYIRGYCLPDYASKASKTPETEPAKSFNKNLAKKYTVTATALNMRRGAGTSKAIIKALPKGSKVTCYGYYTIVGHTAWLYVQDQTGTVGYCSKNYLK